MLIKPTVRGARRDDILAAARRGEDLTGLVDALDKGWPVVYLIWVIEYEVPDRAGNGNGNGELIVLLSTITDLSGNDGARADELAAAYNER